MDGLTGRHHFKVIRDEIKVRRYYYHSIGQVNVMSQRKAWLEYFKIADEQVVIHYFQSDWMVYLNYLNRILVFMTR